MSHRVPLSNCSRRNRPLLALKVTSLESKDYRAWYKLARWCAKPNGLRWRVLVRDMFTCKRCGYISRHPNASDMVADHVRPHRGDPVMFWAEGNVECLCKACHDGMKQREERRGAM
jgi:HNH endonuclease.